MAGRVLFATILLIGLLGLGLWLARLEIAERFAIAALERVGLAPATLTVEALGPSGVRATGIAIGPNGGLHADSIEVEYTLSDLLSGRTGTVRIGALRGNGRINLDGTVSIPALDPVLAGGADSGPPIPNLPIDRLEFRDFEISLETGDAPAVIAGNAVLQQSEPDAIDFDLEISNFHPDWDERLSVTGTVRGADDGALGLDGSLIGMIVGDAGMSLSFEAGLNGAMIDDEVSAKATFSRIDAAAEDFHAEGITGEIVYGDADDLPETISLALNLPQSRLYGHIVGPGTIEARRDDTRITVAADIASGTGNISLGITGDVDDPAEPLSFTFDGDLAPALLSDLLAFPNPPGGAVSITAKGNLATPETFVGGEMPKLAAVIDTLRANAEIRPNLTDILLPGILTAKALTGTAKLSVGGGEIAVALAPGFGLSALTVEPALSDRLPPDLADALAIDVQRDLAVAGETPLHLTLKPSAEGYAVAVSGAIAGTSGAPKPRLSIEAVVALDSNFAPGPILARSVEASLTDLRYAGMNGDVEIRLNDIKSTADLTTGGVALRLQGSGKPTASTALGATTFDLDGSFRFADRTLSLILDDSTRLTLADLRIDGDPVSKVPIVLTVRPGEESTLAGRIDHPQGLDYELRLGLSALALSIPDGDEPFDFDLGASALRVRGDDESATLRWDSGSMIIDDGPITFNKVRLDATFHDVLDGLRGTGRLHSTVHHSAEEPYILPLDLVADARLSAGILTATAKANDSAERILLTGEARHNFAAGSGEAAFRAKRIEFLESVLQPEDLFPILEDVAARVDGAIDLEGAAAWSDGIFNSGMELALDIQSIASPEATLKDVAGVVAFDSISPLTTPPDQTIVIGYADVGVPLEAGEIIFHVKPGMIIRAEARDFDLYGGRVFVDPLDYDPDDDRINLVLGAAGVRIEDMLAPARLGTLEATGVLDGRVPIVIRDGELLISDGILESVSGGHIRYIPEAVGEAVREVDEGTALFLDAVSDFEYSVFHVTIDEDENGDMVLGLDIEGRNPAVYEGVPIELHIAITGEVREVLYSGISTYELPERIADALEKFEE